MGLRGPKPEPFESAMERGVYRADRHGEPVVLGGRVDVDELGCPSRLLRMADGLPVEAPSPVDSWTDVALPLVGAQLVQSNDLPALEMMAVALFTYRLADWELAKHLAECGSLTYTVGTNGAMAPHPAFAIREKSASEFRAWAARFGATPSDRVALGLGKIKGRSMAATLDGKLGANPRGKAIDAGAES